MTGQDRKAKIEIVCADDVITITVEQKGTPRRTEDVRGAVVDTFFEEEQGKRLVR